MSRIMRAAVSAQAATRRIIESWTSPSVIMADSSLCHMVSQSVATARGSGGVAFPSVMIADPTPSGAV